MTLFFPTSDAPTPLAPLIASVKIFVRDAVLVGVIGPSAAFLLGYIWLAVTGQPFATYHVLPIYGHVSLLSPIVWGLVGGVWLQFYRRFLV